jgi:hypothetical protein
VAAVDRVMMTRFGQFAGRIDRLEVCCRRGDRRGSYDFARLLACHGPDKTFHAFGKELAADCPRRHGHLTERCFVVFPQLPALLAADQPDLP